MDWMFEETAGASDAVTDINGRPGPPLLQDQPMDSAAYDWATASGAFVSADALSGQDLDFLDATAFPSSDNTITASLSDGSYQQSQRLFNSSLDNPLDDPFSDTFMSQAPAPSFFEHQGQFMADPHEYRDTDPDLSIMGTLSASPRRLNRRSHTASSTAMSDLDLERDMGHPISSPRQSHTAASNVDPEWDMGHPISSPHRSCTGFDLEQDIGHPISSLMVAPAREAGVAPAVAHGDERVVHGRRRVHREQGHVCAPLAEQLVARALLPDTSPPAPESAASVMGATGSRLLTWPPTECSAIPQTMVESSSQSHNEQCPICERDFRVVNSRYNYNEHVSACRRKQVESERRAARVSNAAALKVVKRTPRSNIPHRGRTAASPSRSIQTATHIARGDELGLCSNATASVRFMPSAISATPTTPGLVRSGSVIHSSPTIRTPFSSPSRQTRGRENIFPRANTVLHGRPSRSPERPTYTPSPTRRAPDLSPSQSSVRRTSSAHLGGYFRAMRHRSQSPALEHTRPSAPRRRSSSMSTVDDSVSRLPAFPVTRCHGYSLVWLGQTIPDPITVPWAALVPSPTSKLGFRLSRVKQDGSIILRSLHCREMIEGAETVCSMCMSIPSMRAFIELERMATQSTLSHVPYKQHTAAQLAEKLHDTQHEKRQLVVQKSNMSQKLRNITKKQFDWNRVRLAVTQCNVKRVDHLLAVAEKQKLGPEAILDRLALAADGLYHTCSFTPAENSLQYLLGTYGGGRAVYVSSKALGLASQSTVRNLVKVPDLHPSAGFPLRSEIEDNIEAFFGDNTENSRRPAAGHQLQIDGIGLAHRVRYHSPSNKMLGLAREDVSALNLTMSDYIAVDTAAAAVHGTVPTVRYAKEATVAVVNALRSENYRPWPIMVSGTGKTETATEFAVILRLLLDAWHDADRGPMWDVGTDRDAVFRRAAYIVLFDRELPSSSVEYGMLCVIPGMNFASGPYGVVWTPYIKHMIKSMVNLFRSEKGLLINCTIVNRASFLIWLARVDGISQSDIKILMDSSDHMNVPNAMRFLNALIHVVDQVPTTALSPQEQHRYSAFVVLGEMCRCLVYALVTAHASLSEQLTALAQLSYMVFVCYREHHTSFMSAAFVGDLQALIKSVFIQVARQKDLNPYEMFYIFLLGSDGLETHFSTMRTVSHDTNLDMLQLCDRSKRSSGTQMVLENYPEWDRGHQRRAWRSDEGIDHINPRFFTGDLQPASVDFAAIGEAAIQAAERSLASIGLYRDIKAMLSEPGVDLLRPTPGDNTYLGTSTEIDRSLYIPAANTTDPQQQAAALAHGCGHVLDKIAAGVDMYTCMSRPPSPGVSPSADDSNTYLPLETDTLPSTDDDTYLALEILDALPSTADAVSEPDSNGHRRRFVRADWIEVTIGDKTKWVHKASLLRVLFQSDYANLSSDRLLRVRCYTKSFCAPGIAFKGPDGAVLDVFDLVACLIHTEDTIACAFIEVTEIRQHGKRLYQIDQQLLGEPGHGIIIAGQVLRMVPVRTESTGTQWVWDGTFASFEPLRSTQQARAAEAGTMKTLVIEVPGELVLEVDLGTIRPEDILGKHERRHLDRGNITSTYHVEDSTARELVGTAFDALDPATILRLLPRIGASAQFPYHNSEGVQSFIIQSATEAITTGDSGMKGHAQGKVPCYQCKQEVDVDKLRGHVGIHHLHSLYGISEASVSEPITIPYACGFCGIRSCSLAFIRHGGKAEEVHSGCPRKHAFRMGNAKKSSNATPSTNHPLECILCLPDPVSRRLPVFWKYNMPRHLADKHPHKWDATLSKPTGLPQDFAALLQISDMEFQRMGITIPTPNAVTGPAVPSM